MTATAVQNRVAVMIATVQARIDGIDPERLEELDTAMAITFDEHFNFQSQQARAHALGTITADEARIVYAALGETYNNSGNGGWSEDTDTATKCVVTKLMAELISRRIGRR